MMVDRKGPGESAGTAIYVASNFTAQRRLRGALPLVPLFKGPALGEGRTLRGTFTLT